MGSWTGDTGSGDYTTAAWVTGVGKGTTFTPAKGDTGKTLFLLNTGSRDSGGTSESHGTALRFYSGTQSSATNAWYLVFRTGLTSGAMASGMDLKLYAFSLRCVRS